MTTNAKIAGRKIFVVGKAYNYANWMMGFATDDIKEADLVVFTGGTDVNPALYGKLPHIFTQKPDVARDAYEVEAFDYALTLGKHMIGICRGAQFLCVMAGGELVQHQYHPRGHKVHLPDGREINVTSDHHQRMYPWGRKNPPFRALAWCNIGFSPFSYGQTNEEKMEGQIELENAYFPEIKALCIQSHPEWQFPAQHAHEIESIIHHQNLIHRMLAGDFDK